MKKILLRHRIGRFRQNGSGQVLLIFLTLYMSCGAHAEWRAGFGFGFGGTGIEKQVLVDDLGLTIAEKSETPGMFHLAVESVRKLRYVVGIEHSRGFRLGPFSSGVGFTSLSLRWHYLRAAPIVMNKKSGSSLAVKRWSPYTGGYFGLAEGTIEREGDLVSSVSASGVHFGLKNGVDYSYSSDVLFRWELAAASTFFQSSVRPATLVEFSLWMGVIFPLKGLLY